MLLVNNLQLTLSYQLRSAIFESPLLSLKSYWSYSEVVSLCVTMIWSLPSASASSEGILASQHA